jgi:alpha-L-rhamnosidase
VKARKSGKPHFTFHGFRYVELSGLKEAPTKDAVTGVVLNSEIPRTGEWESNDPLLNQLQSNIWWGQKGNFLEIPTDCPQRDERLGWTGDAQVFARTAAFNADVAGFFAKWQRDIRDAQVENGAVPCIVPNPGAVDNQGIHGDGGPAWSDATVICPWTNYLVYGDKRVLAENYDVLVRYIQHLDDLSRPHGMIRSHPDSELFGGFGDWLSTTRRMSLVPRVKTLSVRRSLLTLHACFPKSHEYSISLRTLRNMKPSTRKSKPLSMHAS